MTAQQVIFDVPALWNALSYDLQVSIALGAGSAVLMLFLTYFGDSADPPDLRPCFLYNLVMSVVAGTVLGLVTLGCQYGWHFVGPKFGFST